jgi:protein-disulfide isomerase/uncharacterized membrane protein
MNQKNPLEVLAPLSLISAAGLSLVGPDGSGFVGWLVAAFFVCAAAIAKNPRFGTLLTALTALGANGYLLRRKFVITGDSYCNLSDSWSCDAVNFSPASEMFGVPITLFGVAFYAGLAFAALSSSSRSPRFHQVNAIFGLFSVLISVWLAAVSIQLGVGCVMCISIYASNALLLGAGLRGMNAQGTHLDDDLSSLLKSSSLIRICVVFTGLTMVGNITWANKQPDIEEQILSHYVIDRLPGLNKETTLPVIALLHLKANPPAPDTPFVLTDKSGNQANFSVTDIELGTVYQESENSDKLKKSLVRLYFAMDGPLILDGSEYSKGPAEATYHIVEFADYGCPHCAQAEKLLGELVKQRDDVRVTFKPFPLTSLCNPGIPSDGGPQRCNAAFASECAGQQGKFFELSGLVFKNQRFLNIDDLRYHAEQLELDLEKWEQCMIDPATLAGVIKDAESGVRAGVHGTPAVFIKGIHGDDFVAVRGAESVVKLIEAHEAGVTLPAPSTHSH